MVSRHSIPGEFAAVQRALREELAPKPNSPDARLRQCAKCGETFWRRKGKHDRHCPGCAAAIAYQAEQGQSRKEGPMYEKAVLAQLAYWTREAKRLGIALPDG